MTSVENAIQIILKQRFRVTPNEKILIITDKTKLDIANIFLDQASKIAKTELLEISIRKNIVEISATEHLNLPLLS